MSKRRASPRSPIYRFIGSFAAISQHGSKTIATNSGPLARVISLTGFAISGSSYEILPFVSAEEFGYQKQLDFVGVTGSNPRIRVWCGTSAAIPTGGLVITEYVKQANNT